MASPRTHFSIFADWNIAICSAHEPFFGHCNAGFDEVASLLFEPFQQMLLFSIVHFLDVGLRYQYHGNERWYETQEIYSHLNAGVI